VVYLLSIDGISVKSVIIFNLLQSNYVTECT